MTPPKSRNDPCPCGSGKRYKHCHGVVEPITVVAPPETAINIALKGLAAQQAGDFAGCEALYRRSLELEPMNPDVLHMLGVARMQQFEPREALILIQQAADLTAWRVPQMRHNFGWALSVLMSARAPENIVARAELVARIRQERASSPSLHPSKVAVLALCGTRMQADALLSQLLLQSQQPVATVVLLPAGECAVQLSGDSTVIVPSDFPHSVPTIVEALRAIDSDYVQVVDDTVTYTRSRLEQMAHALQTSGAQWAFSKVALDQSEPLQAPNSETPMLAALNGLDRLQHRQRMGDLLIERPGLPITLSNLMFERGLLIEALSDPLSSPPTILGLSLAAMWLAEPHFVDSSTLQLRRHTLQERYGECLSEICQKMMCAFVERVINPSSAPNPLAPNLGTDGVDVLKRALRSGLGSKLNKPQLLRLAHLTQNATDTKPLIAEGIEFIGFARAESGLGENLRSLVRAVSTTALGASVSVTDVDIDSGIRNSDISVATYMDGRMFRTRVICVNPDMLGEAFHHDGLGRYQEAHRVGFWFWELERLPRMWVEHAKLVDEIWVATDFVADAVRRDVRDRPVIKIRTSVITPELDRTYSRTEFGLREDCCLFMFSFAYGSFATRKNPEAVIHAFRRAFPRGNEQVQLVIKTSQSELFPVAREALTVLASGDPRIIFINSYLSRKELIGLQSTIDCYLSLHRSEGLGLGLAECMALGKPAIATAYSGNLEFMKADNCFLVDYKLIPVREGDYPDYAEQMWADASVEHAATHMQHVYTDRAHAAQIGLAGAEYLARHFNHQAVGQEIFARYTAINHSS